MRLPPVRHGPRHKEDTRDEVQGKAKREGTCRAGCAACCRFLTVNVNPDYFTGQAKAWIELHGIQVRKEGGICWMDIPSPCSALVDGRCSVYNKRPKACRVFPSSQAEIDLVDSFTGEKVCTYRFTKGGDK